MPLNEAVSEWCEGHYQLAIYSENEWPVMRHTFSHFHLDITPCIVQVNNPDQSVMEAQHRVWYKAPQTISQRDELSNPEQQTLGLATPISHLLNRLNNEEQP